MFSDHVPEVIVPKPKGKPGPKKAPARKVRKSIYIFFPFSEAMMIHSFDRHAGEYVFFTFSHKSYISRENLLLR